jgi:hypothetical protein
LARAYQSVGDLLLLSRTYDARGLVNLGAVIDATLSLLRNDIDTHKIRVELSVEKNALIHTTRAEIRQLLASLIVNAVRSPADLDPNIAIQVTRTSNNPQSAFIFSIHTNGRWPADERLFTLGEEPMFRVASAENTSTTAGYIKLLLATTGARAELSIDSVDGGSKRHLSVVLPASLTESGTSSA